MTLLSQDASEFALHVRAILGFPIGTITQYGPTASSVILGQRVRRKILQYSNIGEALGQVNGSTNPFICKT